jgi:hypothetical protein
MMGGFLIRVDYTTAKRGKYLSRVNLRSPHMIELMEFITNPQHPMRTPKTDLEI